MGTEILKSFGTLQSELEQARSSLKGVDENIKRLIGRDPSDVIPRPPLKRPLQADDARQTRLRGISGPRRSFNHENDEPGNKRRVSSVFKRLSDRPTHYEEELEQKPQRQMISKVIVTPKEIPSRQEALAAQSCDEISKARNKRMFGALLGTLQKFQQEETKLKPKEDKRAQLEKKIEEHEIREKAEIKKERQELFFNRKKKQAEIKMIELKMMRMEEYAKWEERQKPRMNFIQTKAKPHVCYLPRKLNEANKLALEGCKAEIEKMIDKKRQEVFDELQHIEERMKKNFEPRKPKDDKQNDDMNCSDDHKEEFVIHVPIEESNESEIHDTTNNVSTEENNHESYIHDPINPETVAQTDDIDEIKHTNDAEESCTIINENNDNVQNKSDD